MSLSCSGSTLTCHAGGSVHLRHDPDAAVVVTEVSQLFVSHGSAVEPAFVAFLEQWTQPLEPSTVDSAFVALLEQWA